MNYVVIEDRPSILLAFLKFIKEKKKGEGQIYGILCGEPNAELEELEELKNNSTGSWILVECKVKDDLDLEKLKKDFAWFRSGEIKVLCDFLLFSSDEHPSSGRSEIIKQYASIKLLLDMVKENFDENNLTIYTTPEVGIWYVDEINKATGGMFSPLERPGFLSSDENEKKSEFLYRLGLD